MNKEKERRLLRVGQSIHNELSLMLLKDTKDPALTSVSITGVKMTPDLAGAKVFFSVLDSSQRKRVERSLQRAAAFFQGKLGQILQLRLTPKLYFVFDETPEKSARISEIVSETAQERARATTNLSPEQSLARRIAEAQSIILCCHRKPDGDALGSVLAMQRILRNSGKKVMAWVPDDIPPTLAFMPGVEELTTMVDAEDSPDLTIVLDTASPGQLHSVMAERVQNQSMGHVAVIDHHDQFETFGHTVIRRKESATGQIVFDLIDELIWPMDEEIATCLYAAIAADTGCFRFSNTTQKTFQTAADLLNHGVSPSKVAKALFDTYTLSRQRILGKTAETLQLFHGGKYARLICTDKMLDESGASAQDLEGFVNIGRNVIGVDVAVLYTQTQNGAKASLRSNSSTDVAQIAAVFGGGGHRAAAGVTFVACSLEEAMEKLDAEIAKLYPASFSGLM